MSGLEDLYREVILDHYRSPRNRGELECPPAHRGEGFNPLCGDDVVLYILADGDTIADVKISGNGCSISQASASMMSTAIKGKTFQEAEAINKAFKKSLSLSGEDEESAADDALGNNAVSHDAVGYEAVGYEAVGYEAVDLGDLQALQGVMKFPVRIKCATLGWNVLTESLEDLGG